MDRGTIRVGTSGWHYDHWVGPFYPEGMKSGEFLDFYKDRFSTTEINNSFYRLPSEKTLKVWKAKVPKGFVFAAKGSRYATHMKKLKDPDRSVPNLYGRLRVLERKLGPVLFQLPPRWHANPGRLEAFLSALPKDVRAAFEFRDESWFLEEVYEALKKHGAAFCIYEYAGLTSPREVTADFVYIRLHGPDGAYQGEYGKKGLAPWARAISQWADSGRDVYVYFDNDEQGYAPTDALRLKKMLGD
ncbi:MAG: DUF72 domain-containing protein [Deltaproteobacteria bacterium]|nr:DUF72 domain-containing protein [Deltaproteobacteria bacterium]